MQSGESVRGRCWLNAIPTASMSGLRLLTTVSGEASADRFSDGDNDKRSSYKALVTGFSESGRKRTLRMNRFATLSLRGSVQIGRQAGATSSTENVFARIFCFIVENTGSPLRHYSIRVSAIRIYNLVGCIHRLANATATLKPFAPQRIQNRRRSS